MKKIPEPDHKVGRKHVNIRDYEQVSTFIWTVNNVQLPKDAPWDFSVRRWQIDVLDDTAREIVAMKPTQVGFTTIALCKQLHFAATNSVRTMYTLPRQDDVTDLVNARLQEILLNSPNLRNLVGGLDNVRVKKLGRSFMHFMEASVMPRMLDVDHLVNDEVDLSNQDYLEQYVARLDASPYGFRYQFSTPTIHDFGVHSLYQRSDQREWVIKCSGCNHEQYLQWDVHMRHRNGKTWYACEKCGKQIGPEEINNGRWVAMNPGSSIHGYHISQMMVPYIEPDRLYESYKTMSTRNFYNLRLGLPYTATTGAISRSSIMENCFIDRHSRVDVGAGYFLGADQGNEIHVAVGRRSKDGKLQIVHLEVIDFASGFNRLKQLIERYGVKTAVLDALPNRHSAQSVAEAFPGRVWLAIFSDPGIVYKQQPRDWKVLISKTDSYDKLREAIDSGEIQFYGSPERMDSHVRTAINHLTNMRRDEMVRRSRMGGDKVVAVWKNTGPDHYADAINYLNVAADIGGTSSGFRVLRVGDRKDSEPTPDEKEILPVNPYARRKSLSSAIKRRMMK